jgi:hypothetical protein
MRSAAALVLAALPLGCAATSPPPVPPVVVLPVPPIATSTSTSTSTPTSTPTTPPFIQRFERAEKTTRVTACQISPFSFSSKMVIEDRLVDPGRLTVRVVQDDETATGVTAIPSLLGKGYVVALTPQGLDVRTDAGQPVAKDEAARVQAVASAVLAWPGSLVASNLPAPGTEVTLLEAPLANVAVVPVHAGPPQQSKVTARFTGKHHADDGDELVFDVSITATEGDAGMCHAWTNTATVTGELRLRADGGAMRALHLKGTTSDTEALCQGANGGKPPPPATCDKGDVTVDVTQPHAP